MMPPAIAIVGMSCQYPDARTPGELWENALAQRRAFRRIPPERLHLEDYFSSDRTAPDKTYSDEAALIEGYEFDRVCYRVVGSTFRSADLTHWLALDVAAGALSDAGFDAGKGLPVETTGVVVGNTLTGDTSRANVMRLRWPYVRRVTQAALIEEGWTPERCRLFLEALEAKYKSPFPEIGEETLAGGLSNTIAGRICNHFNLNGGGYTVDGACAASLLAVINACTSLVEGDLDVALAGGVDLSIDPFELIGFAKTGALAPEEMRVYDARSAGFWPGEGCGFLVLMRLEDAIADGRRIYAVLRGWGVSSDGSGGITRPEVEGQLLALRRAYRRAGFGIETVAYFEGHGTGTSVGDTTELRALSSARRHAGSEVPRAVIGSIKANIGHTKAAAGIAGLIKAVMSVHTQLLPPHTGCEQPHPAFAESDSPLRILQEGECWPVDKPLRAGVSAMGFGGINTHVVLESSTTLRRTTLSPQEHILLSSVQDAELFLLDGNDREELQRKVNHLLTFAGNVSRSEMSDLGAELARTLSGGPLRAAIVASLPKQLESGLSKLGEWLNEGITSRLSVSEGIFVGERTAVPRIGLLFPGQGSPARVSGGLWQRRFDTVKRIYAESCLPLTGDKNSTEIAQPAIVTASLAALHILEGIGIEAALAIGHSLGELVALHWAGGFDEATLRRLAHRRGQAMGSLNGSTGAMASLGTSPEIAAELCKGEGAVIAGYNGREQTVISGDASAIDAVIARAQGQGVRAVTLPVSHAFHSSLVAAAVPELAEALNRETMSTLQRPVISTVTGTLLNSAEDLRMLLCHQVTSPVRFTEAFTRAAGEIDIWIEAGPGQVLSGLASQMTKTPVMPLDTGGPSLKGLLQVMGAAFALGAPLRTEVLFAERFVRPFDLNWRPRFFASPCELAPVDDETGFHNQHEPFSPPTPECPQEGGSSEISKAAHSPLELLRQLVSERTELPLSAVQEESHFLGDLHLNSITVGQLMAEAARHLGLEAPIAPLDYADTTIAGAVRALEEIARTGITGNVTATGIHPAGVDSWVRAFTLELAECPLPQDAFCAPPGSWKIMGDPEHPLTVPLQEAFQRVPYGGVVVCLSPRLDRHNITLLLESAHLLLAEKESRRFVLVQQGGGAAFAKTLYTEHPEVVTCVVDVPFHHSNAAAWVAAEAMAARGYTEAHYDIHGTRTEPVLRLLPLDDHKGSFALGPEDVLLVSGGGKGIAAECALVLARHSGVRLALMGRSEPETDKELENNLHRMIASGLCVHYVTADIIDADAVRAGVRQIEAELGPVTAFLHGAGTNVPHLLHDLDEEAFQRTLAPKLQGAQNVLASIDPMRLRHFITFGSLIARTGLRGEADYAVANEWLARLTEQWQAGHPHCRCLAIEWSVWSGVGMAQRLGRVDALVRQGITPITPEDGVDQLCRLLAHPLPAVSVVVTGRFGNTPTLPLEKTELPFRRFLEHPQVYYPGVELVVDVDLSVSTDPYLEDHIFQGERLMPGVIGLEAAAQVAMALAETPVTPAFQSVQFLRPIVVPKREFLTVRIAALVRAPGVVDVSLRCAATAFQIDHFRATCRFGEQRPAEETETALLPNIDDAIFRVPLVPEQDLYGGLLFHTGRFRRLGGYRLLRATECIAEITPNASSNWFGPYLPSELVLGDSAIRDTAIHAIQACIPQSTLLPIGVDSLKTGTPPIAGPCWVYARERLQEGNTFVYDLTLFDADGTVWEQWEGLRLQRIEDRADLEGWGIPLLCPYFERRLAELIPGAKVAVTVIQNAGVERKVRSDLAIQAALGKSVRVWRRPDGKPEVAEGQAVSSAHTGVLTLAVAGHAALGCDVETVTVRSPKDWQDLLGADRFALAAILSRTCEEGQDVAATRVWTVGECLQKAGAPIDVPLTLFASTGDGWRVLDAGRFLIASVVLSVRGVEEQLAFAILVAKGQVSSL